VDIHALTSIPPTDSTGPDPPDTIYHFTTGQKLRSIINSGHIKPSYAHIPPHEEPVAWTMCARHGAAGPKGTSEPA
jgi:hypothetical protein